MLCNHVTNNYVRNYSEYNSSNKNENVNSFNILKHVPNLCPKLGVPLIDMYTGGVLDFKFFSLR